MDLATRGRWRMRRAQCGLGPCCCDLQDWPADRTAEIPPPEMFDAWAFHADDEIPPDAPPAA